MVDASLIAMSPSAITLLLRPSSSSTTSVRTINKDGPYCPVPLEMHGGIQRTKQHSLFPSMELHAYLQCSGLPHVLLMNILKEDPERHRKKSNL